MHVGRSEIYNSASFKDCIQLAAAMSGISRRILQDLFVVHMLFQGVEFLTVKPCDLPHHPHTKLTTQTPSPISPLSVSLCLTQTQIHVHTLPHSLTSPSTAQTSYASVWQVMLNSSVGLRSRWSAEVHSNTKLSAAFSLFFILYYPSVQSCCLHRNPVIMHFFLCNQILSAIVFSFLFWKALSLFCSVPIMRFSILH